MVKFVNVMVKMTWSCWCGTVNWWKMTQVYLIWVLNANSDLSFISTSIINISIIFIIT